MKKLRKRAGSLLLILFMVLLSFNPYTVYAVEADSNDNNAGGQKVPVTTTCMGGVRWSRL